VPVTRLPPPLVLSLPLLLLLHRVCRHRQVPLPSCVKPPPLLGRRGPAHAHHVPMHVFLRDQMAFSPRRRLRSSSSRPLSFRCMHHVPKRGRVQSPGRRHGHAAAACCGGGNGGRGGGGGGHSARRRGMASTAAARHCSLPWPWPWPLHLAAWLAVEGLAPVVWGLWVRLEWLRTRLSSSPAHHRSSIEASFRAIPKLKIKSKKPRNLQYPPAWTCPSLHFHPPQLTHTTPFLSSTPHRQYDTLDATFAGAVIALLLLCLRQADQGQRQHILRKARQIEAGAAAARQVEQTDRVVASWVELGKTMPCPSRGACDAERRRGRRRRRWRPGGFGKGAGAVELLPAVLLMLVMR